MTKIQTLDSAGHADYTPEAMNTGPGFNRGAGGGARGCDFEERVGAHARPSFENYYVLCSAVLLLALCSELFLYGSYGEVKMTKTPTPDSAAKLPADAHDFRRCRAERL